MNDPQPEGHMASYIERRKFLAQTSSGYAPMAAAFRQGLSKEGFVEGRNVAIEYR